MRETRSHRSQQPSSSSLENSNNKKTTQTNFPQRRGNFEHKNKDDDKDSSNYARNMRASRENGLTNNTAAFGGGDTPPFGSFPSRKRQGEREEGNAPPGRFGGGSGQHQHQQQKRAKKSVFHAKEQQKSATFRNPDRTDGTYSDQELYEQAIDHLDYRRLKRYKLWWIEDPEYHRKLYEAMANMGSPVGWSETDEDERIEDILNPNNEEKKGRKKVQGPTLPKASDDEDEVDEKKKRRKKTTKKKHSSKEKKRKKEKSRKSSSRRKRRGGGSSSESSSESSSSEDDDDDDIDEGELVPDFDGGEGGKGKDDEKEQPERFLQFLEKEEREKREKLVAAAALEERKKKEERLQSSAGGEGKEGGTHVAVNFGPAAPPPEDENNLDIAAGIRKPGYGGQLLPGEGSAMAQFVQSGERIPRRGEVGYSSEQIENFEKMGYVMSGSRHARMNAVRLRKENQVYSAEEQAVLAMINYEEKAAKEKQVMEELKRLVDQAKRD